ncbi:MAG: hypothetical protein ACYTXI_33715 [Nostoc sp.]
MQPIKAPEIIIAIVLSTITVGIPKPGVALVNNQASQVNSALLPTKQLKIKQSTLVALDDTYEGPQHDFEIQMPGTIVTNEYNKLASWSAVSQTAYVIAHRYMPPEVSYLSTQEIRQLLQSSMRENIANEGKVVRSTNLVIDGYPGLELLVQNSDGSVAQYQAFLVKRRMYILAAVTSKELTSETINFFDSFGVFLKRIGY